MKKLFVFAIVLMGLALVQSNGFGQTPPAPAPADDTADDGIAGFWELETAGGRFVARIDHISSVSQHEYVIDGSVKVYECTVSVSGGLIGRFYYIEPIGAISGTNTYDRLKEVANKVSNRAGMGDVEMIVTKNYPTTTHSKTSEYRFKNKDTIGQIYDHAHRVVAEERGRGKGNKLTIRE